LRSARGAPSRASLAAPSAPLKPRRRFHSPPPGRLAALPDGGGSGRLRFEDGGRDGEVLLLVFLGSWGNAGGSAGRHGCSGRGLRPSSGATVRRWRCALSTSSTSMTASWVIGPRSGLRGQYDGSSHGQGGGIWRFLESSVPAALRLDCLGPASLANNGGGPRIPSIAKMMICRCLSPRSGGSGVFWKAPPALHGVFYAWSLPDRVRFGRAHPCFTLTVWFQRERCEA
jgi:hypothetical protein